MSLSNRRAGCLYGQAIGDALGIPVEFKASWQIAKMYDTHGELLFYRATPDHIGGSFAAGEWSDDTAQAICLLEALLEPLGGFESTFAAKLQQWLRNNSKGSGSLTRKVLLDSMFHLAPVEVAKAVWENGGKKAAPNGAVMRCSVVGMVRPEDMPWTVEMARRSALVTHADPRCVASTVAISALVAGLISNESIADARKQALVEAKKYDREVEDYASMSLEGLMLSEGMGSPRPPIGYTYKCMGAAFWALRQLEDGRRFEDILSYLLAEGGDADTNGAVAGAVMGAYLGANHLPEYLVKGLIDKPKLDSLLEKLNVTGH